MSDTIVICPRTGNRCASSGCTATNACFLGDPMGGSMNPGRTLIPQHYVPQERLVEVERAARAAEREACAREVAKTRHDLSLEPGVNGYFRSRYMPLVLRRFDALERTIRARATEQSNG